MGTDEFPKLWATFRRSRFFLLLFCLVLYMAIAPLLAKFAHIRIVTNITFSVILFSTIYAVSQKRRHWVIAVLLAAPMLFAVWEHYIDPLPEVSFIGNIFQVLFFAFTAVLILRYVFGQDHVDLDVISAAVVVYMFVGFMWSALYTILEYKAPGSFSMNPALLDIGGNIGKFNYFSFVTLTTLGYGDITPVSSPAKSFAVLEAFIGQLYLTVLIARLVGMQISQSMQNRSHK